MRTPRSFLACVPLLSLQRSFASDSHTPEAGNLFTKAPEALLGMLSSKTDTYALGITFAQVVVMTVPMTDGSAPLRPWTYYTSIDQRREMLADARARLVTQPGPLGAGLASVLHGCWQAEARGRMDTAEAAALLLPAGFPLGQGKLLRLGLPRSPGTSPQLRSRERIRLEERPSSDAQGARGEGAPEDTLKDLDQSSVVRA